MGVIWAELQELYNSRLDGRPPELTSQPGQFVDWARWEHQELSGDRRAELERFWRTELDGTAPYLSLPSDRPRPDALSGRG
jgi:hypothetical protein